MLPIPMARSLGCLAVGTAEHLVKVAGERLVRAGRLSGYVLAGIFREVALAFAESRRILAEGIGHPLRQSHAYHRLPGGLKWDLRVVDLLAQGLGELGRYIVGMKSTPGRSPCTLCPRGHPR